jgi:DegV family protein with EDD domain
MANAHVAVVADSTLALPPAMAAGAGITIVPVHVVVDGRSLREGEEIQPSEVAALLRSGQRLTTSRPSPQQFLAAYRAAAEQGAGAVVSVHLSAELSGTAEAARVAARNAPVPVEVVDTRTIAMAAGYAALDAAAAAADGASAGDAAAIAKRISAGSALYFYVDTLEYLRRGGRIGTAQRYVGQALRVKPLLSMDQGAVTALEKVRTSTKALLRLAELATAVAAGMDRPRLAIHHLQAEPAAATVRQELLRRLPDSELVETEVGGVIGVHTGPGMVAVAVVPGRPS